MMTDCVNIAVPRNHAPLVLSFLAGLQAQIPSISDVAVSETQAINDGLLGWTEEKLVRFVRESYSEPMQAILKTLAQRAGEWVSTRELAAAISPDATFITVAGTLGAAGRRSHNRYEVDSLPYEGKWNYEENCKMHRMPSAIANIIRRELNN